MKIMVGYDGSNASAEALEVAMRHARAFDAEVFVVTSLERGSLQEQDDINEAESRLAGAKDFFTERGIPCTTHLLIRGKSPGEDLVDFAREKSVDFLVVGIRRRSKVGKLLMGSTAQYVILKASCPVICVK